MASKSNFFRVATEGQTTDGRTIKREWIEEIAETYNPKLYCARIFCEHIRGVHPDFGFRCLGDVSAVKAEQVDGKMALFAQIDPTDEMVRWSREGQKVFPSIEVIENFAGSGKAYLFGLAVTDSPASTGTEKFMFASQAAPFHFKADEPCRIQIEDHTDMSAATNDQPSLVDRIKGMFSAKAASDDKRFADVHAAVEQVAGELVASKNAAVAEAEKTAGALKSINDAITALSARLDSLPEPSAQRPVATGTENAVLTDC